MNITIGNDTQQETLCLVQYIHDAEKQFGITLPKKKI